MSLQKDYTPAAGRNWVAAQARSVMTADRPVVLSRMNEALTDGNRCRATGADVTMPEVTKAHDDLAAELRELIAERWPDKAVRVAAPPVVKPARTATFTVKAPAPKTVLRVVCPPAIKPVLVPTVTPPRPSTVPGRLPTDSGRNERDIAGNRAMVALLRDREEGGATMEELRLASGFSSAPGRAWIEKLAVKNGFELDVVKGDRGVTRFVMVPQVEAEPLAA